MFATIRIYRAFFPCDVSAEEKSAGHSTCFNNQAPPSRSYISPLI